MAQALIQFRTDWTVGDIVIPGAFLDGSFVGAAGLRRWERAKLRHIAYIWIVYVDAMARGRGVGHTLLGSGIRHAGALPGVEQMQLSVSSVSDTARRLYAPFVFTPTGWEPKALRLRDTYVDVIQMGRSVEARLLGARHRND